MAEIVKLNNSVYTIDEVINDLEIGKDKIQDIVFITILKDGTVTVSHTGPPLHTIALACKLMDVEFNNLVQLDMEEQTHV